jgi:hypothetical protein
VTVVSVCSLKGAPGVTTLCCLLAAAWPSPGTVAVVEADPSGGDLAARFGLSSRLGWTSLRAATRRSGGVSELGPHLQLISGGLPVLVAARGDDRGAPEDPEGATVCGGSSPARGAGLVVVDLGRLRTDDVVSSSWMHRSDVVLLVVAGDAAAAVQLRDRAPQLREVSGDRLATVVVRGEYSGRDLAEFTGVPVAGELPFDRTAAGVAGGGPGAGRRLGRSLLWTASARLAVSLEGQTRPAEGDGTRVQDPNGSVPVDDGPHGDPGTSGRSVRSRLTSGRRLSRDREPVEMSGQGGDLPRDAGATPDQHQAGPPGVVGR